MKKEHHQNGCRLLHVLKHIISGKINSAGHGIEWDLNNSIFNRLKSNSLCFDISGMSGRMIAACIIVKDIRYMYFQEKCWSWY